jgi:hypothetical protein
MARSRELKVVIAGDADKLERELKKSGNALDRLGKQTKLTGTISSKGYSAMRVGATGAAAALGGLALAGKHVASAYIEAEKSEARMRAQLKASGISYNQHSAQIEKSIQATARLAAIDDEDLQDAFTNIVRVSGNVNESLRLSSLAADIAAAKHISVAKAGELVGKVVGGNVGILKRYGITVKEGATASEALAAVQQKFAGQAEAYGKTTGGAMDRASNAVENLEEKVGDKLAPTIEKGANKLAKFVDEISTGTGAGGRFADKLDDIWQSAKPIVTWIGRATGNVAKFTAEHPNVGKLATAVVGVGVAVKALKFASAATGFTNLLKLGRSTMRQLVKIFATQGAVAGTQAGLAAAGSEGMASSAVFNKTRGSGKRLGKVMGKGLIVGLIAGVALAIPDFVKWIEKTPLFSPKRLGEKIGDKIGNVLGTGSGDGLGSMLSGSITGGATGGLQGAKPTLGPFAALGNKLGLRVSSGIRPGSRTKSGNLSHHSAGNAIDMSGPPGKMLAYFRALKSRYGAQLAELIYTPGGVGVKDGRPYRYTGAVAADHHDHVHVAYTGGGRGPQGLRGDGIGTTVKAARAAGFTGQDLVTMVAIAGAESGYNARINAAGPEDSRGLWQINVGPGANTDMLKLGNLYDPFVNAKAMRLIRARQGLSAWTVYRTGAYKAYLGRARSAVVASKGSTAEDVAVGINRRGPASQNTRGRHGATVGGSPVPASAEVNAYEQALADADLGVAESEGDTARQIAAQKARGGVVGARLQKVTAALKKKGLRPATRLRLTQERASLLGELRSIDSTMKDLSAPAEGAATANDKLDTALSDIGLQERAGLLTPEAANEWRQSVLQGALSGEFGGLDQRQQWEVMGQLRDAQQAATDAHQAATEAQRAATEAAQAQTQALKDLKASLDQSNAIANSTLSISAREATRAFADVISGQLGQNAGQRRTMPGTGQLASVGNSRL